MELLEQFRARYPFPLDDFQLEAIRAIEGGQSVIVSAPTGAGKTLVAEFAIHMALATGKRIAYTTPLKALSNQKFNDFTRAFGADTVGILTGDVKVNPHGRVLVMTTEILRNALYGSGLDDLGYIVLDECHYMGDEARGTVWEEIIVNAPTDVLLVGLSATVANVKEIADWISIVHRPIVPIFHPHRPVPLSYAVADLAGEIHEIAEVRAGRARLVGGEPRGPDDRGRWYTRRVVDPGVLIDGLETRGWLPAIYFIFSRVGCERATDDVLAEGKTPLTAEQQSDVDPANNELIHDSPTVAESLLNQTVFQALRLGVGLHHAGILPSLKRLIELLFERGLCRVVFATETMSLGIHMPARSVVLQGLTKCADRGPQAADRVVVRPVPEPQAHPRAGGGGPDPRGGPRGDQALRGAVRRLPAYRTLPARAPGGGGAAPGPRPRRASGRTDRRGSRDRQAGPRPAQGRARPRADPRRPLDPRPSCAHRRAPAPRRRRPREERGRQADLLGHAALLRAARPRTRRPRTAPSRRRARAAVRPGAPGTRAGAGARGRALGDRVPPVPLGRPAEVRSRVARARDAHGAPRRPAARARAIQERVLAGVPQRRRGARAVRRRARPPTRAAGTAHRRPQTRQRAARRRERLPRCLHRPQCGRGGGGVLGADRGGALGRSGDRGGLPQKAAPGPRQARPARES